MKTESPEARIARLFQQERFGDEASAPDLARLLENPRRLRQHETRAIRRIAFTAAAAAAVAATLLVLRPVRPRARPFETAEAAARAPAAIPLANWKSPTDAFLRTPGTELWSRIPELVPRQGESEVPLSFEPTKGVTP